MLIRLSRLGDLDFVNDVILLYRRHDANLGAQPTTPRQAWLVRCLGFHSSENSPAQQRNARRGWRAYQLDLLSRRLNLMTVAIREGSLVTAAAHALRLPVYAWRYLRGYPVPRAIREPLRW